jgi:hypothetical protein
MKTLNVLTRAMLGLMAIGLTIAFLAGLASA